MEELLLKLRYCKKCGNLVPKENECHNCKILYNRKWHHEHHGVDLGKTLCLMCCIEISKKKANHKFCEKCRPIQHKRYKHEFYMKNREKYLLADKLNYESKKEHHREYKKQYRMKNREKIKLKGHLHYLKNTNKICARVRLYAQKNHRKVLDKSNEWRFNKYHSNLAFNLKERLSSRLRMAIRSYVKNKKLPVQKSYRKYLDYDKIVTHLMKTIPTTDLNELSNWHIDHVRPLASFDLTEEEEVIKAYLPENLQWLSAMKNIKKGKKWGENLEVVSLVS